MTALTVIVPTIPKRTSLVSRCLYSITEQPGDYEILLVPGTAGLGSKYMAAAQTASGRYVTLVDDDDYLAASYMAEVLPRCDGVDYVGLVILALSEGKFWHTRATSASSTTWESPSGRPQVYPTQLTVPKGVVRTELARKVDYPNYSGADRSWADQVSAMVETWHDIDRCLYVYDHWPHKFGLDAGGRDVGCWPFDESKIRRLEVHA